MATRIFKGINFFQEILKRTISVKFHQNLISTGSFREEERKMFKVKGNTWTDGRAMT